MPYLPHEYTPASIVRAPENTNGGRRGTHPDHQSSHRSYPRSNLDDAMVLPKDEIRIEDPQRPSVNASRSAAIKGKTTSDVRVDTNGSQYNKGPIEVCPYRCHL